MRPDWKRLYEEAFPHVYQALTATLFDREAALDALHDAFEEGLRRPPARDDNLPGWLYRVALRKARRARMRSFRAFLPWTQPRTDPELERVLARLEVTRLLKLLTERQRSIVVAYYFLGLRQEEIAELLGVARGTVNATIQQALASMRRGLGNVG